MGEEEEKRKMSLIEGGFFVNEYVSNCACCEVVSAGCVCECVCVRECARARARVCVCVGVCA